ncbi:MAG: dienelactone hydrolase family protein [Bacteroidetes bacterium]|nr:dienelactone hydrolase family protein [Bacteroidota bacterium]
MKRITMFLAMLMLVRLGMAQNEEATVCHTSSTDKFAMFASSKEFNMEHRTPRLYVHVSLAGGEMIKFKCADGTEANGFLLKSKKPSNKWIFVFQEWWGLNDNIKRQSEDLYNDVGDVNVLALDMYDGNVASDRETAGKYMQAFKQDRGDQIVKGALEYVGEGAKVGTVGWCFGGGQSLLAALNAGKQASACVMYYGMPVEDVAKLKTLNCEVLNIWGTKDKWINKDVMDKFEKNMKDAGRKLTIKPYDADHGFANPSNPMGAFNEEAYKDAYKNTVAFFKAHL